MKMRWELIQAIIDALACSSYLEIGCNQNVTFNAIRCKSKVGVDPIMGGTIRLTSDQFFAQNTDKFDIIFIDGLHEWQQVIKDVDNALNALNENGTIVIHDCDPPYEECQLMPRNGRKGWCGDVWKAYVKLRTRPDIDCVMSQFDCGCGVIKKRKNTSPISAVHNIGDLTWEFCDKDVGSWKRRLTDDDIMSWIKS